MKATYVQRGENLDFKNTTDALIEAGDVVVLGSRAGVAGTPIHAGETGSIHMTGVFRTQKKAGEAIDAGADVFYTVEGMTAIADGAPAVTAESAAGTTTAGYAVAAAAADDTMVTIKIG